MNTTKMSLAMLFVGTLSIGATHVPNAMAGPPARPTRGTVGATLLVVDGMELPNLKVELLAASVEVVDYTNGKAGGVFKKPGKSRLEPVEVKGVGTMPPILLEWWQDVQEGKSNRKDVAVRSTVGGKVVASHYLRNVFPSRLAVDPATNRWTLTLVFDQLQFFQ